MAKRRRKARTELVPAQKAVVPSVDERGWVSVWGGNGYTPWQITQGFQLDINRPSAQLERNWVVFACMTLIAGDIGKLRMTLNERRDGVWQEIDDSVEYLNLLRSPNEYQTWQQFIECWSLSKTRRGNTYVLLVRNLAERVRAMHVLDPDRVTPLIAPDGSVYYRCSTEEIAELPDEVVVPASEIIHDRYNCLFHPLVGIPPLFACAMAAQSGLTMQATNEQFFRNGARPGGILVTPNPISPADMARYKKQWEESYSGAYAGRTAVLGNGLSYTPIRETAVDSEIVDLLKLSAEMICSVFHVPAFRVGVGPVPIQSAAEVLTQVYYDTCLQTHLEATEALIDKALELDNVGGRRLRSQFDLDDLVRMDQARLATMMKELVGGTILAPDEARARIGYGKVKGGKEPISQQQNWPLSVLAEREPPMASANEKPPAPAANDDEAGGEDVTETAKAAAVGVFA